MPCVKPSSSHLSRSEPQGHLIHALSVPIDHIMVSSMVEPEGLDQHP